MPARNSPRLTAQLAIWFIISAVFLDYATGQKSCSASNSRPGVCVPMLECEFIKQLLLMSPKPLPPTVIQYLRNSHCATINKQQYACCDLTQYRGVTAHVEGTAPQPTAPPAQRSDEKFRVVDVKNSSHSSEETDPSSIGLSMLQAQTCGAIGSDRVANGINARLSEYPWMALLVYNTGVTNVLACGGTLITEQHVLTAAHCIRIPATGKLVAVRLGEHDTKHDPDCSMIRRRCAPPVQEITISEAIVHEEYNSATLSNDIGILRLKTKAIIESNVIPICLPITDSSKELPNRFIIAGWGKTENGLTIEVLQKAPVDIVDNDKCRSIYSNMPITEKQICAGGENGTQACMGDSGGPLMYFTRYKRAARMVQYGIVSGGSRTCGTEYPGVYTLIEPYLPWIATKIGTQG